MQVFHYDPVTKAYTGSTLSMRDPLEPDRIVVPAHATELAPPSCAEGEHPFFTGQSWVVVPTLLGKTVYTFEGTEKKVRQHLHRVPEGMTLTPPPSPRHFWDVETEAWVEPPMTVEEVLAKRQRLLTLSDWTQMPDSPLSAAKQAEWVDYRQALRDVTDQEGFPANINWPVQPE